MPSTIAKSGPRSRLNILLWSVQAIVAAFYAMVGLMKIAQPIPVLAKMMGWPGVLPEWFVRFVGTAELAGAIGLILPLATGIRPGLTRLAAAGLMLLQVCAMIFHISRGEFRMLPINAVLLALAAFIFRGRSRDA